MKFNSKALYGVARLQIAGFYVAYSLLIQMVKKDLEPLPGRNSNWIGFDQIQSSARKVQRMSRSSVPKEFNTIPVQTIFLPFLTVTVQSAIARDAKTAVVSNPDRYIR